MAMIDDIFNTLALAGTERAAQARHDAEAFAREKKGYAARLRIMRSYLVPGFPGFREVVAVIAQIDALIADLERE